MTKKLKTFVRNQSGATAIIFSLSAVALIMAGGVAVDLGHGAQTRTQLQTAADSALLAAVRVKQLDQRTTNTKMKRVARRYFNENLGTAKHIRIRGFKIVEDGDSSYKLEVDARLKTSLMRVFGVNKMDVGVISQADVAPGMPVELALVLDNTGSMSGTKLSTLKTAATKMVDDLMKPANKKVKMAIVPFSQYVNVGLANRNANWISVPNDNSQTTNQCWNTYPDMTKSNCRMETRTGSNDGVPYTYEREVCDYDYGEPVEVCGQRTSSTEWRGCVGSRDYPNNVNDKLYRLFKVPGLMNTSCTAPITPLTDDKSRLKSEINAMNATGETYIPGGLSWGWRVLSSNAPYKEGKSKATVKSEGGMKALVLMTDGANTKSPDYPKHNGSDANLANDLTAELCTAIKNENIYVYTIAFEVSDTTITSLLKQCASGDDYFFNASDSASLAKAFDTIAGRLSMLRLTR